MAEEQITILQNKITTKTDEMTAINNERVAISKSVDLINGTGIVFTDKEKVILNTLLRETNYSNNNILTTNLNDIATTVDVQEELYQDAEIALSEKSQPQLSFSSELDNLFALKEFESMKSEVDLLNYIRLSIGLYDDELIKLRIVSIQYNPIISTTDLTIEFSNMTHSLSGISDLAYLISQNSSGSSSGSSSSSSGSGRSSGGGSWGGGSSGGGGATSSW